ncbi:hypothetical protein HK104_010624 [Borealophlyctis nickersoniae]|nr:hypothetical protein HK104_010624 [Borealophlyctis nickersoniae]
MPPKFSQMRKAAAKKEAAKQVCKPPPEPETFEEMVEGGQRRFSLLGDAWFALSNVKTKFSEALSREDKGDRYRDGEKSRRFYERAAEMYERAAGLKEDPDVLYNWSRILLMLSEFTNPPYTPAQKMALLDKAMPRFAAVATLAPANADNLFNWAQALRGKAELMLESEGEVEGGQEEAVGLLQQADDMLQKVFDMQREEWEALKKGGKGKNVSGGDPMEVDEEADRRSASSSGLRIHVQGDEDAEFEPLTADALAETLTAQGQVLALLSGEVEEPESTALFNRAIARFEHALQLIRANEAELLNHDSEDETQLRWAEVLADRADILMLASGRVEKDMLEEAVRRLDSIIERNPRNVEALCDRGDVLCAFAEAKATLGDGMSTGGGSSSASVSSDPEPDVRTLYCLAAKSFQAAASVEPSSAPIAVKLGDVMLTQIPYHSSAEDLSARNALATKAVTSYQKALQLKDPETDVGSVLLHLSKALSYLQGRESECKKTLAVWKRRGREGENELDALVGWGEFARDAPWNWETTFTLKMNIGFVHDLHTVPGLSRRGYDETLDCLNFQSPMSRREMLYDCNVQTLKSVIRWLQQNKHLRIHVSGTKDMLVDRLLVVLYPASSQQTNTPQRAQTATVTRQTAREGARPPTTPPQQMQSHVVPIPVAPATVNEILGSITAPHLFFFNFVKLLSATSCPAADPGTERRQMSFPIIFTIPDLLQSPAGPGNRRILLYVATPTKTLFSNSTYRYVFRVTVNGYAVTSDQSPKNVQQYLDITDPLAATLGLPANVLVTANQIYLSNAFFIVACVEKVPTETVMQKIFEESFRHYGVQIPSPPAPLTDPPECTAFQKPVFATLAETTSSFKENVVSKQDVRKDGKKGSDDEIEMGEQVVTFRDPLTLGRTFLSFVKDQEIWKCVVCNKEISISDMIVDAKFFQLLEKYPNEDRCVIDADGSDRPFVEAPPRPVVKTPAKRRASEIISLDSSEDEAPISAKKAKTGTGQEEGRLSFSVPDWNGTVIEID